jgi:ribonuclease-3 family protein
MESVSISGLSKEMSKEESKQMQPLVLAMIGDSVQTLFVREFVAKKFGVKVNKMNKMVTSVVSAGAQFETFKKIEDSLSDEELDIARRARNANIHTKAKNFSYTEYIYATALEAVFGFLYLSGQTDRLNSLLTISLEELKEI